MNGYWFGTYSGSNSGRMVTDWQHIADRFPGVVAPKQAEVVCQWSEQRVALTWRAEIRTHGSVNLLRSQVRQPSVCEPLPVSTWEEFRRLVEQREQHRYIYRGQEKPWRLCTPFHRTGRGDTRRFM